MGLVTAVIVVGGAASLAALLVLYGRMAVICVLLVVGVSELVRGVVKTSGLNELGSMLVNLVLVNYALSSKAHI